MLVRSDSSLLITNVTEDAALFASGGFCAAGIGGDGAWGEKNHCGSITITGGVIDALAGSYGAGIGGGVDGNGGTIRITGGTVTARGTGWGAGIGGGDGGNGGTVSISGGVVTAIGGGTLDGGAGIGGGSNAYAAEVTVSGGTVVAQAGSGYATDVGSGAYRSNWVGSFHVTGGSLRLVNGRYDLAPSNATDRVWCVTVTGLVANAEVRLTGLNGYGRKDLFSDEEGRVYLWLPDGVHRFGLDDGSEHPFAATVSGGDTFADPVPFIGVTVNGRDVAMGGGDGWKFVKPKVLLDGNSPCVISGSGSQIGFVAEADCAVTLSNLVLVTEQTALPPFDCASATVELALAGTNRLSV